MQMDFSNNPLIQSDELMALVRERLDAGFKVRYLPFQGVSMLPLLRQGRDAVELSPLPEKLRKYDIAVYQYPSGKYVMHRIVKVKPDCYICLGDNTLAYETIAPEQMLGVVSAITRDGKRIEVSSPLYRLYCRVWSLTRPARLFWKHLREKTRRWHK